MIYLKLSSQGKKTSDPSSPRVTLAPSGKTPRLNLQQSSWGKEFFANLAAFFTEKPVRVSKNAPGSLGQTSFGGGFGENLMEWFRPLPASARHLHSRMTVEWRPWYRVLWENLRDAIAPPKLPPLRVTSKPVAVKSIWSKDEQFGRAQVISLLVHVGMAVLIVAPIIQHVMPTTIQASPKLEVTNLDISPYVSKLPPGKDKAGGGGGGGDRTPLPPTKGRAPRFDWLQKTPPMAVIRNPDPKLPAEPTLLGPPDLKVLNPALSNYGDPLAKMITGAGGPGGGGGIGTGCCGGIGSGEGGGLGPGSGGGTGGGVFRAGTGGVGYAQCLYCPQPQYSEEARKAKYQGSVMIQAVITTDGRAINIRVVKGPGLGLEEKAIEAVKTWKFVPAKGPNGQPVNALVDIEVTFRLL